MDDKKVVEGSARQAPDRKNILAGAKKMAEGFKCCDKMLIRIYDTIKPGYYYFSQQPEKEVIWEYTRKTKAWKRTAGRKGYYE